MIERFVDTRSAFEWGLVCHALAGEMREILEDWHLLITQLEHQQLLGKLDLSVSCKHIQVPFYVIKEWAASCSLYLLHASYFYIISNFMCHVYLAMGMRLRGGLARRAKPGR